MVQINWTYQSISDLKSIAEFISKDSKTYAKLQIIRIKHRTKILHSQVYSGKIVPELNKQNTRELIEGSYRIIYKVVHHSAKDLGKRKI